MLGETMVVDVSQDWMSACDVQQRFLDPGIPAAPAVDYAAKCRTVVWTGYF